MPSFDVTGMTCQHCVAAVTRAIGEVDPAAAVAVDLQRGKVVVQNGIASEAALIEAIASEGYEAVPAG